MSISYCLKKSLIYSILKRKQKKSPFDIEKSEHFELPADAETNFNNSYYFSAHHANGESLFLRLGLRGNGEREIWFAYRDSEHLYSCPMSLCTTNNSPIKVFCEETGSKWKILFDGVLECLDSPAEKKKAHFEGTFIATAPIFDFFLHSNLKPMAKAFAIEKWNRNFFKEVQKNNQTHYEQPGILTGELTIGDEKKSIDMPALRDHSFGKRDWNYMDKHVWLMALLENGDALNISMVSYPAIRNICVGNLYQNGNSISAIEIHTPNDLIGNGKGADTFTVHCRLENGDNLLIKVTREIHIPYFFSDNQYQLLEGIGRFMVNDIKARGIIEFGFNKDLKRW